MVYNPKKYWQKRCKNYTPHDTCDELLNMFDLLNTHMINTSEILEVGSGDGRLYNYLKTKKKQIVKRYVMCDFAESCRKICKKNTGILPDGWDGIRLPYESDSFDCLISFSVMLHVPCSDIGLFFKEHVRVTKTFLFIATWWEDCREIDTIKDGISHGNCFMHNYYTLFKDNDAEIIDEKSFKVDGIYKRRNWFLKINK